MGVSGAGSRSDPQAPDNKSDSAGRSPIIGLRAEARAMITQTSDTKGPEDNALRALSRQAGLETGAPGPALSTRNPTVWAITR